MYVSVALCTYNGEQFVSEQLESILQQTRPPDQIVIRDDCSEDDTVSIIRDICGSTTDANIDIEVNAHRLGVQKNFCRALAASKGDVIFFCDQDDVWFHDRVERMLSYFVQDPTISLVYCDAHITDSRLNRSGYTLFTHNSNKKDLALGNDRRIGELLKQGRNPGIKASSIAFRSWVKDGAGSVPPGVDHDSWLAFFGYALGNVVAVNEPLYFYRRHKGTFGASSSNLLAGESRVRRETLDPPSKIVKQARLAKELEKRMQEVAHWVALQQPWNHRYARMYVDVSKASRMLAWRASVITAKGKYLRRLKALQAVMAGSYAPYNGCRAKLKCMYKDLQ